MPELLERAGDADPAGVAAVPVGHRVRVPWRAACRVGGEGEGIFRHPDAEGRSLGAAALEPLGEQLAGERVQGQQAAFAGLGRFLDPVALLDDVGGGDPDLLTSEVEPVLAQRANFAAPGSGRDRGPQVQAEFLVFGADEVEPPGSLLRGRRVRLAVAWMRWPGVAGDVIRPIRSTIRSTGSDNSVRFTKSTWSRLSESNR